MGKRGPLAGSKKRGAPTGIRFDPDLKTRLEKAKPSGRSFSEEVAARLEASFGSVQFHDPLTKGLAALIAHALDVVAVQEGRSWHESQRAWRFANEAVREILSFFEPGDAGEVPDDHPTLNTLRAQGMSDEDVAAMKQKLATADLGRTAARIAIARCELAAEGMRAPWSKQFEPVAEVMKEHLERFGSAGDAEAWLERKKGIAFELARRPLTNRPPEFSIWPSSDASDEGDDR